MSKITNYNKGESLATGFVRPKVTALFFDKIWVPESILLTSYEYIIPEQVLLREKEELTIDGLTVAGKLYYHSILPNEPCHPNEPCSKNPFAGDLYRIHSSRNYDVSFEEFVGRLMNASDPPKFKYSKNRNAAIMLSSENFSRKYHLHISPVYHDLTEFERDTQALDVKRLYKNGSLKYRVKKANTFCNKEALSICIQDFPSIIEEKLSWEQVLDIRKDKKMFQQLKRFTSWSNMILTGKEPNQIRDILESELDSYKEGLKEHGVVTAIGGFSTIITGATQIASIIAQPDSPLLPILSIASVSMTFAASTYFSNYKNRNNPIAYLYNIENPYM